jgi:hypothetical protein
LKSDLLVHAGDMQNIISDVKEAGDAYSDHRLPKKSFVLRCRSDTHNPVAFFI